MDIWNLKYIETPRLLLRPVQAGDEIAINKAINHSLPSLERWMPWAKDPSLKTTRAFVERVIAACDTKKSSEFPIIAIHKDHNKLIGVTGFNENSDLTQPMFEIGYWIDSDYQGQGLVTEFVNAQTRYALDGLNATRVQIVAQTLNEKSIAVAQRLNFAQEAIMKNYAIDCVSGKPADSYVFACCDINSLPPLKFTWKNQTRTLDLNSDPLPIKKSKNPRTQPVLTSKRLQLIPPREKDAQVLYDMLMSSVQEVGPWFLWAQSSLTLDKLKKYINNGISAAQDMEAHNHLFYLVWERSSASLLGDVWIKINDWTKPPSLTINYLFDTKVHSHGYATEAVAELTRFAFEDLTARRVQLHISQANEKSIRVARRLGYEHEGTLINHSRNYLTSEVFNTELYSMTTLTEKL